MRKFIIVSLIAAGALILTGALVFASAAMFGGMNSEGTGMEIKTKEYEFGEQLTDIKMDCTRGKIEIRTSDENVCRVICDESERIPCTVKAENGTLIIKQEDNSLWYESLLQIANKEYVITVYLPEAEYNSLDIENISGSITVAEGISAKNASLTTVSGAVKSYADVSGDISCKTTSGSVTVKAGECKSVLLSSTSGKVELSGAKASGDISINDTSGRISVKDTECHSIKINITSGKTELSDVIAEDRLEIRSVSGAVILECCDADDIYIKNTSGRVSATLLSGKQFTATSTSGRVKVPQSTEGGKCEVNTVSGGIEITVLE